jgi:hypothetical protein
VQFDKYLSAFWGKVLLQTSQDICSPSDSKGVSESVFGSRAHNTGQNLDTGISVFLIYETGIPVLTPVFQK